jgi:lipoprotein-releasing system permease protein
MAASTTGKSWPAEARTNKEVIGVAPYVSGQVLLTRGDSFRGALLRGILPG